MRHARSITAYARIPDMMGAAKQESVALNSSIIVQMGLDNLFGHAVDCFFSGTESSVIVSLLLLVLWPALLSFLASSIADRWAMLSSWLFHTMLVSGGKARRRFIVSLRHHQSHATNDIVLEGAYRILIFLPPSILVQTLSTSSPVLMLSTAPHTSSPASAN